MKNNGKGLKICERVPEHPKSKEKILQNLGSMTARNLVPNSNRYGTKTPQKSIHFSPNPLRQNSLFLMYPLYMT